MIAPDDAPADLTAMHDKALVDAFLAGSGAALVVLVRRLQPSLIRVAGAVVGSERAEDITQEAWIRILRGLPEFRWGSALKTWAIRVTLNQAYSDLRRQRRQIVVDPSTDEHFDARGRWRERPQAWHQDTPEAILASAQLSDVIRKELDALPEAQRLAVLLRDVEGLEMGAVCNILEVSASNARVLLHRGRNKLREAIDAFQAGH
ncbi:MAG: sigma-70 family RNA polymerase sigma factor [Gammaproteobacteria bacterium]|nr:sigma-70 family RNA polymerase sigma factor [Gammaproteobacteria bacterium]